jgi:TonB family protein
VTALVEAQQRGLLRVCFFARIITHMATPTPLHPPRRHSQSPRVPLALCCAAVAIAVFCAPPAAADAKVRYATSAEVLAMFPKKYTPSYPYEARRARMHGSGIFRLYIDKDGVVTTVGVIKSTGHKLLDINAAYGLIHWRAHPGRAREVDLPVTFSIGPPRRGQ